MEQVLDITRGSTSTRVIRYKSERETSVQRTNLHLVPWIECESKAWFNTAENPTYSCNLETAPSPPSPSGPGFEKESHLGHCALIATKSVALFEGYLNGALDPGPDSLVDGLVDYCVNDLATDAPIESQVMMLGVNILFGSDEEIRRLNLQFRGLDEVTDVLSFAGSLDIDESETPTVEGRLLMETSDHGSSDHRDGLKPRHFGDLYLAAPFTPQQSKHLGLGLDEHIFHLVLHGLLHLLGHDHEETEDAERMEAIEIALLRQVSYGNPYRESPSADAAT